jgi:integrase
MGVFKKQGVWWIDYYINGRRRRERIGPDKRLADTVLRKRKVEIAEGKFLERRRPIMTTFDELADAYLHYATHQQRKRSWPRDRASIRALQTYFGGKRLTDITPASIEQYRTSRRATASRRGRCLTTASINRELTCLKRMFNVARKGLIVLQGGVPLENPVSSVSLEREHNERDRVLTAEEFARVYDAAATWLKPMILIAYHTGMRQGEIRSLRWDHISLRESVIRLRSSDTKTDEPRIIPLPQAATSMLNTITRYVNCPWVFINQESWQANPELDPRYHAASVTRAFARTAKRAGVMNATFHDLRHTFVTNMRRAGVDYFRIMAITGHKTMRVFKRYHTIDTRDLREAMKQMDTYMDTTARESLRDSTQTTETIDE